MKEAGVTYEGEVTKDASSFSENPKKVEDVNADAVIVGGGPSGLAAAITIKQADADANVVYAKTRYSGGNGKFDMNYFDMVNSKAEVAAGNVVTADDLFEENSEGEARVRAWADW